ncbi:high-affinity choline transporter 1-like [Neosynchiropus ocellatus]
MAVNIPGLIVMLLFYLLVLGTGIWASRKSKRATEKKSVNWSDGTLLGNRGITLAVGVFTTTATYVGGGFIVGISELVYTPNRGLVWSVMPVAAIIAFIVGGIFYAKKMRQGKYVTMMDPIQRKFGKAVSGVLSVALVLSDIFWVTSTLIGLGTTMTIILDLSYNVCIWISAVVAVTYTLFGGLYSVAYTDIVQLVLTFVSLWFCVPFVLMSEHSIDITQTAYNFSHHTAWVGSVDTETAWKWLDQLLLLTFCILGSQEFHQRTLSAFSPTTARLSCFIAAPLMLIFAIPSVLIGAVAVSTDWNLTSYGSPSPYERDEASHILPLVLQHLTPSYVSVIGIGAVGAAVMSSTDSGLLSAASIFSSNIYKNILRTSASEREMQWVVRVTVVLVGVIGTSFTLLNNSVMVFWIVGADITYIFTFPALTCALYCKFSNGYGGIMGVFIALLLRVLSGEPEFGLPAVLQYPGGTLKDGMYIHRAPISTICMLSNLFATIVFSYLASMLFNRGILPQSWDILGAKTHKTSQELASTDNYKTNDVDAEKIREAEAEHMMETSPLETSAL